MQSVLSVRGLSKTYPGVIALQDVSFSLAPGEIRALCGENGAGKSTFVKILMGIVQPDSGSIAINGQIQVMRGAAAGATPWASDWSRRNLASHRICRSSTTSGSAALKYLSCTGELAFACARNKR